METIKKDLDDFVTAMFEDVSLTVGGAPTFTGLQFKDQLAVIDVFYLKACQGEILVSDKIFALEKTAEMYSIQRRVFDDFVLENRYNLQPQVASSYPGKIAMFSYHGTVTLIGRDDHRGRRVQMARIHSPAQQHDGKRCLLLSDLEENGNARLGMLPGETYTTSPLRRIAVSYHGENEDDLLPLSAPADAVVPN